MLNIDSPLILFNRETTELNGVPAYSYESTFTSSASSDVATVLIYHPITHPAQQDWFPALQAGEGIASRVRGVAIFPTSGIACQRFHSYDIVIKASVVEQYKGQRDECYAPPMNISGSLVEAYAESRSILVEIEGSFKHRLYARVNMKGIGEQIWNQFVGRPYAIHAVVRLHSVTLTLDNTRLLGFEPESIHCLSSLPGQPFTPSWSTRLQSPAPLLPPPSWPLITVPNAHSQRPNGSVEIPCGSEKAGSNSNTTALPTLQASWGEEIIPPSLTPAPLLPHHSAHAHHPSISHLISTWPWDSDNISANHLYSTANGVKVGLYDAETGHQAVRGDFPLSEVKSEAKVVPLSSVKSSTSSKDAPGSASQVSINHPPSCHAVYDSKPLGSTSVIRDVCICTFRPSLAFE